MNTPSPDQLERWANMLQKAATALSYKASAAGRPGVVTASYDDIRAFINQVTSEMYRAHDQAAVDAWDRIREVARRERGAA